MRITINGSARMMFPSADGLVDDAKKVADDGFDGYWLAQIGLADALAMLTQAAPHLPGVELGTAVVPTFTQHPVALAQSAMTAQAFCDGRLTLGMGLNHKPIVEGVWGMAFDRPVRHLREYLDILDGLFNEGQANVEGELFTLRSMGPSPRITDRPPSIMVAAMGPQMLRLAGRRTDGTILWMTGPRTIAEHIAPIIGEAAAEADRGEPRIVASLPIGVTDDVDGLRSFAATAFAGYGELPSYRAMMDREGAEGPADLAIIGNEDEVSARLEAIADAGATEFAASEIATNDDDVARTRELLKRLR